MEDLIILGVVLGLLGIPFIFLLFATLYLIHEKIKYSGKTTAKVISCNFSNTKTERVSSNASLDSTDTMHRTTRYYNITYLYAINNTQYQKTQLLPKEYKIGDTIQLCYNTKNFNDVKMPTGKRLFFIALFIFLVFLGLVLITLLLG